MNIAGPILQNNHQPHFPALSSQPGAHSPLPGPSHIHSKRKRHPSDTSSPPSQTPPPMDSADMASGDPHADDQLQTQKKKKKKAARACAPCQKAHLTCDDSRPCQRCVRKGVQDSCVEGHRKKAKYLLDDEELEALKREKGGKPASAKIDADNLPPADTTNAPSTRATPETDSLFNLALDPNYPFGSATANLEYSILSAMLGNPTTDESLYANQPQSFAPDAWSSTFTMPTQPSTPRPIDPLFATQPQQPQLYANPGFTPSMPQQQPIQQFGSLPRTQPPLPSNLSLPSPPSSLGDVAAGSPASVPNLDTPQPDYIKDMNAVLNPTLPGDSIYSSVVKPYDYTQGYHFLMRFLSERFEKNDILRVVRALAIYRPSLIALQMPMSEQDEVFVERALQRSLLEMEKLISFSGTPTAIWRRTGEICAVGQEFAMITGWSREDLCGGKYIYELFEAQSVVEYWENFASHAFENSTHSVNSSCVLLKPNGEPVSCAFCFKIRRDMFDLPSLIIGQWLPLFS